MRPPTPQKAVVSGYVEADQRAELVRRAHEGDRSVSAEVRRAVTAYLANPSPERRPSPPFAAVRSGGTEPKGRSSHEHNR